MKEMTPEQKAEELYTPHDNMFMAKRKAFVEGANWQSPTPEAVAVAFALWLIDADHYRDGGNHWKPYVKQGQKQGPRKSTEDMFTLFTASPEYKELFK